MFTSELIAVHAIADYPDVEAELARIPLERRVGPIVINDRTRLPPTEAQCRHYFRLIARKAGIPDSVWNKSGQGQHGLGRQRNGRPSVGRAVQDGWPASTWST